MLTVLATALDDYVCERMTESVNLTAGMPEAGFTTKGNKEGIRQLPAAGSARARSWTNSKRHSTSSNRPFTDRWMCALWRT